MQEEHIKNGHIGKGAKKYSFLSQSKTSNTRFVGWLLFYIKVNDISVIYAIAHRCAGGMTYPWVPKPYTFSRILEGVHPGTDTTQAFWSSHNRTTSIAQWDLNSQCKKDPYALSLNQNSNQIHCTIIQESKTPF